MSGIGAVLSEIVVFLCLGVAGWQCGWQWQL
jgi:hypothetical protein